MCESNIMEVCIGWYFFILSTSFKGLDFFRFVGFILKFNIRFFYFTSSVMRAKVFINVRGLWQPALLTNTIHAHSLICSPGC